MKRYGRNIEARDLSNQARGQWLTIYQSLCPGLFDEAINNLGQHVRCPFHGGENDFRFLAKSSRRGNTATSGAAMCSCGSFADGFAVLRQALNLNFVEVLQEVDRFLNGDPATTPSTQRPTPVFAAPKELSPEELARQKADILKGLRSLWNNARRITSRSSSYFQARGISPSTLEGVKNLRYLPSLGYYDNVDLKGNKLERFQKVSAFPAILGLMRDANGDPVAVHRSWISRDYKGKAPVRTQRKLTRAISVAGATIRLFDGVEDTLGIAEGIETALAVRELSTIGNWEGVSTVPVWACFSESNIRNFEIPVNMTSSIKRVIVFADNDKRGTGINAGESLKQRFAKEHPHIEVLILAPETQGWDWLDYLVNTKQSKSL